MIALQHRGRSLDLRAPGTSVVTNGNSTESNLLPLRVGENLLSVRVGENFLPVRVGEQTKWKASSASDAVASQPLKMDSISAKDSIKTSAKDVDIKGSSAGLSPVEEVDPVEKSN